MKTSTTPVAPMHAQIRSAKTSKSRWIQIWHALKRDRMLYLIASPMLLFFLIFKYVPMRGVLIAFKNYTPFVGFTESPWVGFQHFQRFFQRG